MGMLLVGRLYTEYDILCQARFLLCMGYSFLVRTHGYSLPSVECERAKNCRGAPGFPELPRLRIWKATRGPCMAPLAHPSVFWELSKLNGNGLLWGEIMYIVCKVTRIGRRDYDLDSFRLVRFPLAWAFNGPCRVFDRQRDL